MVIKLAFSENDEELLAAWSERLRRSGFKVYKANTLAEARELLDHVWVHTAVLDMRMEDDHDSFDFSGIDLAEEAQYEKIPKIILTNYASVEAVRKALGSRANALPPAVKFLTKEEGIETLIPAIETAVKDHLAVNWSLETEWAEGSGLSYYALADKIDPSLCRLNPVAAAEELEDLFRILFAQSDQITIDRLIWQQPGRIALVVFAYSANNQRQQHIVVVGQKAAIQREQAALDSLSSSRTLLGSIQFSKQTGTLHYAASLCNLPGSDLESIKTFKDIYLQGKAQGIQAALRTLTESSLNAWQENKQIAAERDLGLLLRQRFGYHPADPLAASIAENISQINSAAQKVALGTIEQSEEGLRFFLPNGITYSFPDPVSWFSSAQPLILEVPLLIAPTFGNVKAETILVDSNGRTWLSDFYDLDLGPVLVDFAALETAVKFDLTPGGNLVDWHEFEMLLMAPDRLDGRVETGPAPLRKAAGAIKHIRALAAAACSNNFQHYLMVLAFQTIDCILAGGSETKRARRDILPLFRACLSLGLILERLAQLSQPVAAGPPRIFGLEVDERNRQVMVDGFVAELTPTYFNVILHLWQRPGQLCSRADLYEAVYQRPYKQGGTAGDDDLLNVLIQRVRQRIELDTANPRYLITMPGEGFILYPQGKP